LTTLGQTDDPMLTWPRILLRSAVAFLIGLSSMFIHEMGHGLILLLKGAPLYIAIITNSTTLPAHDIFAMGTVISIPLTPVEGILMLTMGGLFQSVYLALFILYLSPTKYQLECHILYITLLTSLIYWILETMHLYINSVYLIITSIIIYATIRFTRKRAKFREPMG